MGAHSIELDFDGKLTKSQILSKIEKQRKEDREYNGHQEGYSGEWQTIPDIAFREHRIFDSYNDAHEYCLENAEKWSYAIAVKYRPDGKDSRVLANMKEKLRELIEQRDNLARSLQDAINEAKSKTIGCTSCESKINRKFVKRAKCPVCDELLLSQTAINRIRSSNEKVEKLKKKVKDREIQESAKNEPRWLVAGWAAS